MCNSPSTTGLDLGGAHGRGDIARDGSRTEQRPAGFHAVDSGNELADSRSVMEPNRKSSRDNAEPPSSYNAPRESPDMIPEKIFEPGGYGHVTL